MFPALEAVRSYAEDLRTTLCSSHRKPRHWEHPTDVHDDEAIVDLVRELREWLDDPRTKLLNQDYFLPYTKAIELFDTIPPGVDLQAIWTILELLGDAQDSLEAYINDLAERALGTWGAWFFWQFREELPESFFEYDEQALAHVDVLLLPPATSISVFVPTRFQQSILNALDGVAMKKMQLASAVCGGEEFGNLLYRPNGITELRTLGLVVHKYGIGFYRPDAPPPGAIKIEF